MKHERKKALFEVRSGTAILAMTGVLVLTGCSAPAPTTRNYNRLALPDTPRLLAFQAAERSMRERYRIASSDPTTGEIRAEPFESNEVGTQMRVSDIVGVRQRVRTSATARVTGDQRSSDVWCKVLVERLDTTARGMFLADKTMNDLPSSTPADRDGATTQEQNEFWRSMGRDKQQELAILESVAEHLAAPK